MINTSKANRKTQNIVELMINQILISSNPHHYPSKIFELPIWGKYSEVGNLGLAGIIDSYRMTRFGPVTTKYTYPYLNQLMPLS